MKTAYVILISRKDGKPFYEEDDFCTFITEDESEVQITYNKTLADQRCEEYQAIRDGDITNRVYKYTVHEVNINV